MKRSRAFTLLELLVSVAVVALLGVLIFQLVSAATTTWRKSRERVSTFQDARAAFDALEGTLSKAVLNSRLDYADAAGNPRAVGGTNFSPTQLLRDSRLHFVSGPAAELIPGGSAAVTPGQAVFFQAPLGFSDDPAFRQGAGLLNATGFFVEFGDDHSPRPVFLKILPGQSGFRFRLKQWIEPTEENSVYASTAATVPTQPYGWFQSALPTTAGAAPPTGEIAARSLGEDIFALICLPAVSPVDEGVLGGPISPDYRYDSRAWWTGSNGIPITGTLNGKTRVERMRNQLPPFVKVAAFALERSDADRLQRLHGTSPPPELAIPAGLFTEAANFDNDVLEFERQLLAKSPPIRARIFRTTVPVAAAQWSND